MRKYSGRVQRVSVLLVMLGMVAGAVPAAAAGTTVSPATVTQSYNASSSVLPGMLVELKPTDPTTVLPLPAQDIKKMLGVVVPTSAAPIVLAPPAVSSQQVLVASAGQYSLLVSNQDGPVKAGDPLTISALAGIAMKAGADQPEVIGRAGSDFSGTSNVIGTEPLKNAKNVTTTVAIGHITANLQVSPNPQYQKNASGLSDTFNRLSSSVTNDPAHAGRVGLSIIILLATFFVTGVIFYSGVRNGMVAIGRNPLAETSIGRGLTKAIVIGIGIFAAGVLTAYLILSV